MSKTSTYCKDRWNRDHYDMIMFRTGNGGKEAIKAAAEAHGMSVAAYLRHLVIKDNPGNPDISAILGGGGALIGYNYAIPDGLRKLLDL